MSSSRRRARARSFTDSESSYLLSRLVLVGIGDRGGRNCPICFERLSDFFSDDKYFSAAPVQTGRHIELIREFEHALRGRPIHYPDCIRLYIAIKAPVLGVSESARSLSSAFVHQALLLRPIHSN